MTTSEALVLGLDVGTSGVKAILVDGSGRVIDEETTELTLHIPRPGWSEQSPEDWWSATVISIGKLMLRQANSADRIQGVGVSGQMHGAVFLDSQARVLRPAILWNDQRSDQECGQITQLVGFERLVSLTGNRAYPGFQAPKILWVRNNEPDVYRRTSMILLPKDYINLRLTNALASEPSDAAGTLLLDVNTRDWSSEVLTKLELSEGLLAPVMNSSSAVIGAVSPEAATATGLRHGTKVVAGGADNACAALGSGIADDPATVMVSLGTSGTVLAPSPAPRIDPQARLHTFCHALDETWYSMGVVLSAGGSLRWFRDVAQSGDQALSYDQITSEAANIPVGSQGVTFLPYLSGERTPHAAPNARGVFFGLSLGTTRADLSRAVLEGITFALRDSMELLLEIGIEPRRVRVTGGGARSRFWLQMLADVMNVPIWTVRSDAGPAYGAAILAGAGTNLFESAAETAKSFAPTSSEIEPDSGNRSAYDTAYSTYRDLYPALAPLFASPGTSGAEAT